MSKLRYPVLVKLGDHIDTDLLAPGKYLKDFDPALLGTVCLRDLDPEFPAKMAPGGFLVAGVNFGCGSSRETAPTAVQQNNAKAIIAEEFARIFYRSAINIGLICIECKGITGAVKVGDELEIDVDTGLVKNLSTGVELQGTSIPPQLKEQFEAGGLIPHLKKKAGIVS
jgi:3-isopropylmalate/(R)-2-methylmalate dehydratase small subunit